MKELLQLIADLRYSGDDPIELFSSFAGRLRMRYGPCAVALLNTINHQENEFCITALYDHTGKKLVASKNLIDSEVGLPVFNGDFVAEILNSEEPVLYRGKQKGISPIFGDLFEGYIDAATFPIFQHSGVDRWFLLLFVDSAQIDTLDVERTLLVGTLAMHYMASIQDTRKLQEANDWIDNELESVAHLKEQLLPQNLACIKGIKIVKYYVSHSRTGGDYYDAVRLSQFMDTENSTESPEAWGFIIADASGHGAAAAVEIAMFDAILRTYPPDPELGPAGVFNYANRHFFTRMIRHGFITAFVSSYHPKEQIIRYANAGHPPPIIKRAINNKIELVEQGIGIPLGVTKEQVWESIVMPLSPGDCLVLYTDGITESKSENGEQFGFERLLDLIRRSKNDPDVMLQMIVNALKTHQQGIGPSDDQTLLIIQPEQEAM